jgi:hypothetical protein
MISQPAPPSFNGDGRRAISVLAIARASNHDKYPLRSLFCRTVLRHALGC